MTDAPSVERAVVFGGSGFLGRRVAARLLDRGIAVRVASRGAGADLPASIEGRVEPVAADVRDPGSVERAVRSAGIVVNAVALYEERGADSFRAVHVDGAATVAAAAHAAGARLVHISGIGTDAASDSSYVRCRAAGEAAVREACPGAVILRPCVMFGPDDAFLGMLVRLVRSAPVIPLFGDGSTRLQPVHVDDVAEAAARVDGTVRLFELGGPEALAYRDLLQRIGTRLDRAPTLIPMPFPLWRGAARAASLLPNAPVTLDQVILMERDSVPSPGLPGLAELGIVPQPLDSELDRLAGR